MRGNLVQYMIGPMKCLLLWAFVHTPRVNRELASNTIGPFPTIPKLGKNCCYNVVVFYVGNKRCCIVLYCNRIRSTPTLVTKGVVV